MLTVLMATYNGSDTLPTVLEAYRNLEPPKGGWKLIIVDNGSTDQTKQIITACSQCVPLHYIFEPRRGRSTALNTGLRAITGDLVVFTDDDVIPSPDYLQQLRDIADCRPRYSIFGGRILPRWEIPPDHWILEWVPLCMTYGITPPTLGEGLIPFGYVFGANMAIRACIFDAGHRFDPSIGPQPGNYPMGSETELLLRLSEAGHIAWHCPHAVVEHMIQRSQMTKAWVLSKALRYGRGQMRLEMTKSSSPGIAGTRRSMIRGVVARAVKLAIAKLRGDAERTFRENWELQYLVGQAIERRTSHIGLIPWGLDALGRLTRQVAN